MATYRVKNAGHGLQVNDCLLGGDHFREHGGGVQYRFRGYSEDGTQNRGDVHLQRAWLKQNVEYTGKDGEESEEELAFIRFLEGGEEEQDSSDDDDHRRKRPVRKTVQTSRWEPDVKPKVPRPRKKTKEEAEQGAEQVKEERTGSGVATSKARGKCPDQKSAVKRKPLKPAANTRKQIAFIRSFATRAKGCTCEPGFDFTPYVYKSREEAETGVRKLLATAKKKAKGRKPESCSGYTILEKDGNFLILETNSSHSVSSAQLVSGAERGTKRGRETDTDSVKRIRPSKEPELSEALEGSGTAGARFYVMRCCSQCAKLKMDKSVASEDEPDTQVIQSEKEMEAATQAIKKRFHHGPDQERSARTLRRLSGGRNNLCRIVHVKKIQPNEKKNAQVKEQQGWTLHHTEMESLFWALSHGWTIVVIYIDRDCCLVCAATLGGFAPDVHDKIVLIDWDKV